MKFETNPWSRLLFGAEQNFVLWVFLLTFLHFAWINPFVSLGLLVLAGFRRHASSFASNLMMVLWGVAVLFLHFVKLYELSYFLMGVSLPFFLAAHFFFPLFFVVSRRSLAVLPALGSLAALYPGAFYTLHEPGFPIPAMFTASGFLYIPFLPFYYILLKNQQLFIQALKLLNW